MIIGISGKFCSGKDLVADYLVKRWSFRKVGFATKLKSVCADLFGMVGKDRSLLQQVGAAMRGIDDLVWVHYALKQNCADERIVVSDVRYRNEAEYIQSIGGKLIRLECSEDERVRRYEELYGYPPSREEIEHISETDLDSFEKWDYSIHTTFETKGSVLEHIKNITGQMWPRSELV